MTSPFKPLSLRRLPPLPGNSQQKSHEDGSLPSPQCHSVTVTLPEELNLSSLKIFLTTYPQILEEIVLETVDVKKLSSWIQKKSKVMSKEAGMHRTPYLTAMYGTTDIVKIQAELLAALDAKEDILPYLSELLNVISRAVNSISAAMYVIRGSEREMRLYVPNAGSKQDYQLGMSIPIAMNSTVAAHVAATKKSILVQDLYLDSRFPHGIGVEDSLLNSVLCVPVTLPTNDLICVMEFGRNCQLPIFTDVDAQLVTAMVSWVGLALHQRKIAYQLSKQTELNDFLLEISHIMFNDVVEMDMLVKKIMLYAKELVQADRCALFLVDHDTAELYANLFDEGKMMHGRPVFSKKPTLRFSMEKGIAGLVARTGEVVNIKDAYADSRFNREIDRLTGYTTHNILCMPIISHGVVIGVIQMINKLSEHKGEKCSSGNGFSSCDESAFKMFAVYCALALHYSKVHEEMKLKSAQVAVMGDQLAYHSQCNPQELRILVNNFHPREVPVDFDSFYFYGPATHEDQLMQLFVQMLGNLFGPECYIKLKLCNLIATIRKNYRALPYHNWGHGWNVAHCMYCVLTRIRDNNLISNRRMQALMIAALGHDIDHRGFNNSFYSRYNDPLAYLYNNSTMENHHFEVVMSILQREANNIFCELPSEEYTEIVRYMRHAIIATDLALHFPNQKKLSSLIVNQSLNFGNPTHLDDIIALLITACDLCAVSKCWEDHLSTIDEIYDEFHNQGDHEKALGDMPTAMLNRDNKKLIPQDQIGFFKFVCIPCYQTLSEIIPEASELLVGCKDNLDQWERVIAGKSTKVWEPAKSVVTAKPAKSHHHK